MSTSTQIFENPARLLSVRLVDNVSELGSLTGEWNDLYERCPDATPFQRPEWLVAWIEIFCPRHWFAITIRDGSRLIGLALLLVYHRDGKNILAFAGGGVSDYLGILCEPGREAEVVETMIEFVVAEGYWDVLELTDVAAESALLKLRVFERQIREHDSVSVLPLPEVKEELLGMFSKRQRANLRNAASRMQRSGGGRIESATSEILAEYLDDLFRLHTTRWAYSGQPGVLGDESTRAFHERCAPALLSKGILKIHRLKLGEQTIAVVYSLWERGAVFCYMQGFDPAYAKLSPGTQIMFAVIEEAQTQGIRKFDFLRGQEAYKQHWRAQAQPTFCITTHKGPLTKNVTAA
jgi:CelD/BcsL family acetyltransferase involved in cellulose biosynthesis